MYNLRARCMNPDSGRFWTMDTYEGDQEDPASLHKYQYCAANPINGLDPSGQMELSELMGAVTTFAYMAANVGLRAAPALARVTVVVFEATTGETVAIGGGAAITGYAALSRVEGGIGAWTTLVSRLRSIKFGPYGYLQGLLRGTTVQANHLNQSGAYKLILRKAAGCIELSGNALVTGTEHNQFHASLETFWAQYRKGGSKFGHPVTNKEYLQALRTALGAVKDAATGAQKIAKQEIEDLVAFAEKEQKGYGYFDGLGGRAPQVPDPLNLKKP